MKPEGAEMLFVDYAIREIDADNVANIWLHHVSALEKGPDGKIVRTGRADKDRLAFRRWTARIETKYNFFFPNKTSVHLDRGGYIIPLTPQQAERLENAILRHNDRGDRKRAEENERLRWWP